MNTDSVEFAHMQIGEDLDLIVSNTLEESETGELSFSLVLHRWTEQPMTVKGHLTHPVFETACGLDIHEEIGVMPMTLRAISKTCSACKVSEDELEKANAIIEDYRTR